MIFGVLSGQTAIGEQHRQHDEFESVQHTKLVECAECGPPAECSCALTSRWFARSASLQDRLGCGADRASGGALAGGEAAPISFDAEAAPVLNAKTCEVRRRCLAHDSSRTMTRRRSVADQAERAMPFLTAQNFRRSGPELATVQWTPMDHPGKSARSWATSLGAGSVTW